MKKLFFLVLIMSSIGIFAQDSDLCYNVISELSQKKYHGRGYYKDGDIKAADFIRKQYEKIGLEPLTDNYLQEFSFPVNTFHGKAIMSVDGLELQAGKDFVMREYSSGIKGEYSLYYVDTTNFDLEKLLTDLEKTENKNSLIVIDFMFFHHNAKELAQFYKSDRPGFIMIWDTPLKFYKAYSSFTVNCAEIWVSPDFPRNAKTVKLNIENKMIEEHNTANVIGYIEGKTQPDSLFLFTAHYDHLGVFGKKVYFPGANDNASGVAMLIALAEHYSKPENQPDCSMVFIATAGEETGLRGAYQYVENPLIPLEQIKYVINCDMIADNSKDIYVEISESGENGLDLFNEINDKNKFFTELHLGELAGNSDHFPFAEKNIPAIFFMMEGDAFKIYHTPQDNYNNIYLDNFPKLYKLISKFVETY
ncbi:MAG: M28 family peptidase [Bacteroidales bacterium]|nr:M28 family peptidase [Bacteroidales bacterium]